ncbi:MAG: DHCW motif cupin fold protein [Ferruginibacter sp.]
MADKKQTGKISFEMIDWSAVEKTEHRGESGIAFWQIKQYPGLRIRLVEYSAGYLADHWCQKGHIVHCLEGVFISELENGETFTLSKGMSYVVSDNLSSHRSVTATGVKLLIIDGDFLK